MWLGKKKVNRYIASNRTYFGLTFVDFDTLMEYMGKVVCFPDSEKFDEWIYIIRLTLYSLFQIRGKDDSKSYSMNNSFVRAFYDDFLEFDITRMDGQMSLGCIHEYEDDIDFEAMQKIIEKNKSRLTRFLNYIPSLLYVGTETRFRKSVERAIDILVGVEPHQEEWVRKMEKKSYLGIFKL